MCLDKKTRITVKKGIGYKVFKKLLKGKDILYQWNFSVSHQKSYKISSLPLDKWLNEKTFRVEKNTEKLPYSCNDKFYPTGFHIYRRLSDAKNNIGSAPFEKCTNEIYMVEFKNVLAQGTQDGAIVSVAKNIKIIKQIKGK